MPTTLSISPTAFQKNVLEWFDRQGRKNLPWQQNKSPYRVWISEVMLQQTQVKTVIPYFLRFLERFPNVAALADAHEDEVLHLWTGLGYYSRARNLHQTAKIIKQINNFPDTLVELEKLPGIGRSTAGAILAIAFEKRAAILDGNVKRVLTRITGITEWPGEKNTLIQLWELAEKLTPTLRVADYTQAMMDLGATLCVRGQPHCESCPLNTACSAHHLGIEKSLPRSKPKKKLPVKTATFLILKHGNTILLEKRPEVGVWRGLWSLPEITGTLSTAAIKKHCNETFFLTPAKIIREDGFRHTFSHFHLDILPVVISFKKIPAAQTATQHIWYDPANPSKIGLPMPVKKLLNLHTKNSE